MNLAKKLFNLLELGSCRPKNLGWACVIVDYCNRKNLESHLLLDFAASLFILVGFDKFVNCVVILVCIFPPVWAQLAYVAYIIFLKAAWQRAQLFVNLY